MSPAALLPAPVRLSLWRDRDPEAMRLPGMDAGGTEVSSDPVGSMARLAGDGIQFARLEDPVDLDEPDGAAAVAALVVVRELTSHGIAVDWTLRMPGEAPDGWRSLSHLHPPAYVLAGEAGEGVAADWRSSFHIAKCGYRNGPGFMEIRDRRTDAFRRLVIRNPNGERAIAPLLRGVPVTALPETVAARHLKADLLHQVGRYVWWAPYRIRRWPLSSTIP